MTWLEFSFHSAFEAVDWVKTQLSTIASNPNVQIVSEQFSINDRLQTQSDWAVTLRFSLPSATPTGVIQEITECLSPLCRTGLISELEIAEVAERSRSALEPSAFSHFIGNRFVVLEVDRAHLSDWDDKILIRLSNSLAFGSGLHPATRLSLQLLDGCIQPGMTVLDLGCGSGILSVAMAKLGAKVLAIDNDAIAIQATQTAIMLNQVESQVTVMVASLGQGSTLGHWMGSDLPAPIPSIIPSAQFDLIAANILGRIHLALAADYRQALRPQGLLISAGYTSDYEADVNTAFLEAGFERVGGDRDQEWVALVHRLH
jgi:ribosomal protein L11 methyltransferase